MERTNESDHVRENYLMRMRCALPCSQVKICYRKPPFCLRFVSAACYRIWLLLYSLHQGKTLLRPNIVIARAFRPSQTECDGINTCHACKQ
jgi:hypothetical protein